jgi:eukaryotic translation initiation factor 2C
LTQQLASLSVSSSNIFPVRPAFGHDGQEVVLWANYFKLEAKPQSIYKYGVIVTHQPFTAAATSTKAAADRQPKEAKGAKLQRIITAALAKIPSARTATEFKAQVISLTELKLPASNAVQVEYTEPGRPRVETWNVMFSKPTPIRLDQLVAYLGNMKDASGDAHFPKFPEELDALGVIIGHTPRADNGVVAVGRGRFFATDARKDEAPVPQMAPDSLLSILRGYFQSVRPATGRLLLNVNVTHGVFRRELPLANLFGLKGIDKMNFLENTTPGQTDNNIRNFVFNARMVDKSLNRAKIQIKSPSNKGQIIQRFMTGLAKVGDGRGEEHPPRFDQKATDFRSAYTTSFFLRKPAAGSKATIVPGLKYDDYNYVADYFRKKYNIVADRKLPLINVCTRDRPEYMLAELCKLAGGQATKAKLNPFEQDAMIKFACRSPPENAISITTKARELLRLDDNTLLSSFGLSVAKSLVTVKGRELSPPMVIYNGGAPVKPNDGGWLMKGVRVVKAGDRITKWSFIYSAQSGNGAAAIKKTVSAFAGQCRKTGLDIAAAPTGNGVAIQFVPNENTIKAAFEALPQGTQFVLVVLPKKDTALYNVVKKVADVDMGVTTVCVVEQKLTQEKGQLGYFTNVAVKLNLKTGGINQSLQRAHSLIGSGKTMVVGYDVTHPTNMAIRRDKDGKEIRPPSMVGLVASVDQHLAQWPAESWSNDGGVEMLDHKLVGALKRRLAYWQTKNNKQLPQNILIYRDGVSEGQFKTVLEQELPHIRQACQDVYGAKSKQPRITIVVSVKRHQTRFYPTDPNHIHKSSKSPKEGTVVDRGVTNVRYWDFFMQAHASLQGKQLHCPSPILVQLC